MRMGRSLLVVELVVLFVGLPLAYRFSPWRIPALPLLWVVAGYAWWQLARDPSFDHKRLWDAGPLRGQLPGMLSIFLAVAAVLWASVHWLAPRLEWNFVGEHPMVWALVIVAVSDIVGVSAGFVVSGVLFASLCGIVRNDSGE
jgi:hypothetical protein